MKEPTAPWMVERETLTRSEADTDPKYGCKPDSRPLTEHIRYGFANIDKPAGPSSHEVTAWVKKILRVSHAGHAGTLEVHETGEIQA